MNKFISLAIAMLFVMVSISFAQGTGKGIEGNQRKGKYTYKKMYKQCFKRGEIKSAIPLNSPSDKTMKQWKKLYTEKNYNCFKCTKEWDALSDSERQNIFAYLYKYAKDSPTPAKCQ